MAVFNWQDVWASGSRNFLGLGARSRPPEASRECEFRVGTWAGPNEDLLCVRSSGILKEAERYVAPPGRTIAEAAVKSAIVRVCVDLSLWLQEIPFLVWEKNEKLCQQHDAFEAKRKVFEERCEQEKAIDASGGLAYRIGDKIFKIKRPQEID